VNDPGTAIDVIGRAVRLLVQWARHDAKETDAQIACPRVWVPALQIGDMFDDVFAPIARDGAGLLEIQVRLQKAFVALMATNRNAFGDAARRHSAIALKRVDVPLLEGIEEELVPAIDRKGGAQVREQEDAQRDRQEPRDAPAVAAPEPARQQEKPARSAGGDHLVRRRPPHVTPAVPLDSGWSRRGGPEPVYERQSSVAQDRAVAYTGSLPRRAARFAALRRRPALRALGDH
jgi:hypothetical protein